MHRILASAGEMSDTFGAGGRNMVDHGLGTGDQSGSEAQKYEKSAYSRKDPGDRSAERRNVLASVVRKQVIPQLEREHRRRIADAEREQSAKYDRQIVWLVTALLKDDQQDITDFVVARQRESVDFTTLYRNILAPAAQRLGVMWCDDDVSFMQVTLATARLQSLVHEFSAAETSRTSAGVPHHSILLARAAHEEHTLGLLIVASCFNLAGWHVSGGADVQSDETLFRRLQDREFDVLGLSVGSHNTVESLAETVAEARRRSRNRSVKIGLGGPAVLHDPELHNAVGADFAASDGMQAVNRAEELLDH